MFSEMVERFSAPTNRLYAERDRLLRDGRKILDVVSGNVNAHGMHFPAAALKKIMGAALAKAQTYHPDPLGQPVAREAVSRFYRREGLQVPPGQIVLTPGTSVSYWYAFKTLADPGDEILCPRPSYPLFEAIAAMCGVRLLSYPLRPHERWNVDFQALERAVTDRTRAIVLISPHNPTGAVATEAEIQKLAEIALRRHLAIISDEVFSPFLFNLNQMPRPASTQAPLVLTLNGFSKMFALPGMKIGWMAVTGEPSLVHQTVKALDMVSDTFLPVNEAAQFAMPGVFKEGQTFLKQYGAETRRRRDDALKRLAGIRGVSVIPPEGGFYVTMRLPEGTDEEKLAVELLSKHSILMHPGFFYDLEGNHLVLSYVLKPALMREALGSLIDCLG